MSRSDLLEKYSEWLNKEVKNGNIFFYKYSLFSNIEAIGRGGFGSISSADYDGEKVALKNLNTKEVTKNFANELRQLRAIKFHPNINQFYGISIEKTIGEEFIINRNRRLNPILTANRSTTLLSVELSGQIINEPSLDRSQNEDYANELKAQGLIYYEQRQAYCALGEFGNSLEDLNKALNIGPNDAESLKLQGIARNYLGIN
ncbi:21046_t:CDS:2 [Cetraspora pellucida]|uniref:21046_t:CDS:1 n=1 Tax=Cetraspora pellucida TaxID=1433469 RepID=A0A9N8W286_9GLOM|nr:21046_t:CDS:2 [Cetraspora pellucida]